MDTTFYSSVLLYNKRNFYIVSFRILFVFFFLFIVLLCSEHCFESDKMRKKEEQKEIFTVFFLIKKTIE